MCVEGFYFWPLGPLVGVTFLLALLAIAGAVFTIVMLVDCLQRPANRFYNPITSGGQNDKIIWAVALIASFWLYFVPSIVYYFVVMKGQPPRQGPASLQQQQPQPQSQPENQQSTEKPPE